MHGLSEHERLASRRQAAWLRLSHPQMLTEQERVEAVQQVHRLTVLLNEHTEDFGLRYPRRGERGVYAEKRYEAAQAAQARKLQVR